MGCLRLCGVRTAGEATRQAELSPFSIAPWATAATSDRVQHAVVVHPADGMISIIKVTVSRGRPPESHFRGSIGVLPVPPQPHPLASGLLGRDVQADACTHVRVEISRLAPQEVYEQLRNVKWRRRICPTPRNSCKPFAHALVLLVSCVSIERSRLRTTKTHSAFSPCLDRWSWLRRSL